MKLYPHQRDDALSKARFKVNRWGRRSGKTALKVETMTFKSVSHLVKLARQFPNRSVIFVAPTQKQARTIVWEALKARLAGVGKANESRLEMQLPTEDGGIATIFVGGWENRENYRGMSNVIHVEFDEVDTMKNFFIGWEEIFKPMLMETGGSAGFGGTPKKENPNLRRLEKEAEGKSDWHTSHATSWDNPNFSREELEKAKEEMDHETYLQEIMAEYVENQGALFRFSAVIDTFTNTITKDPKKYLIVDIADDGSDKTKFSFWEGLEEYRRESFDHLNTELIVEKIREFAASEQIPYERIAVDAIGVGAGVASNSQLTGIIGYKSSYAPIKTDVSIVLSPQKNPLNQPLVSDYKNLRSQCVFKLADLINNHKIASRVTGQAKEAIIDELPNYADVSKGDGKRMATTKEEVSESLGHSPDDSDCWIMRMYFELRASITPEFDETAQAMRIMRNRARSRSMQ